MTEETLAVLGREGVESRRQGAMKILQGAGSRLAQMRFEFGEHKFNGVEIGTVRRQVADANPLWRENPGDVLDLVGGEVIEADAKTPANFAGALPALPREDDPLSQILTQRPHNPLSIEEN